MAPSLRAMKYMLKICSDFADLYDINFNLEKLSNNMNDKRECQFKISSFYWSSYNKVTYNFGKLQPFVVCRLFKAYCCSFYGSGEH